MRPSPSHRPMTSLCVSRPSNQHPVRLIHHPIAFRRLVFKGPLAVFLLACQLSSSLLHPTSTIFLPIYSWLPRSLATNPPPVSDQGEDISNISFTMFILAHIILNIHVFLPGPSAKDIIM
ncbi:hypothetical protein CHARACLAT_022196 [Characodon lateralis]|uniref:Uncharacterized protein n=1 Tax=Characodon lateralis TaxID=208331 RepID=A0ABU7D1Q3_9TELE|nr:hypothetical protein [Characodon lateralis]